VGSSATDDDDDDDGGGGGGVDDEEEEDDNDDDDDLRIHIFWDVMLCRWMSGSRHYEGRQWLLNVRTTHITIKGDIPREPNSQEQSCEVLKYRSIFNVI
jgi:hypothetical protein